MSAGVGVEVEVGGLKFKKGQTGPGMSTFVLSWLGLAEHCCLIHLLNDKDGAV